MIKQTAQQFLQGLIATSEATGTNAGSVQSFDAEPLNTFLREVSTEYEHKAKESERLSALIVVK